MSNRSAEWFDEFELVLDTLTDDAKELVLDGAVEVCPVCRELSAYAWQDATAYDDEDTHTYGMRLRSGTIGHIGTSSCWEFECAHCQAHCVDAASPMNHREALRA